MHLWAVLSGRRESPRLVRRYSAMQERKQEARDQAPMTAAATSRTTAATKEA